MSPKRMWRGRGTSAPPAGFDYFVSPDGSAAGDGSWADPWDIVTAFDGGYPPGTVQPGDTVWLRGGTYTGQFTCALVGTSGNPITFRGYPGERVTIDGNYDPNVTGNANPTIYFQNFAEWLVLRDVEITNSNTFNNRICSPSLSDSRGDDIWLVSSNSKIINCILHDGGEGIFPSAWGPGGELYGCLIYYEGEWAPITEQNEAAAIDLPDASGTAVALSGSADLGGAVTSPATLTISHNNTGDYTVVAVYGANSSASYANFSATFDGAAMTLVNGINATPGDYRGNGPVAVFGIAGHAGTHDAVISHSTAGVVMRAIVQSFVNVHQTTPPSAGGTWAANRYEAPPFSAATSSAANHMVVDGIGIYNAYSDGQDYAPSDDNTGNLIGGAVGGNNPVVRMSYASGAASVDMGWDWTRMIYGHGHGTYTQEGIESGLLNCIASDNTITQSVGGQPWYARDIGSTIYISGAGPAGADFQAVITTINSTLSIEVDVAPSTNVTDGEGKWAKGKTIKDNIYLDQVQYGIQTFGSSGASFLKGTIEGNLWVYSGAIFGGLAGYWMTDTVNRNNCFWEAAVNIGFNMAHMTNYSFTDNYCHHDVIVPTPDTKWENMVVGSAGHENTLIGTMTNFDSSDFPDNDFYTLGSPPTTNEVIIRDNDYEPNRANIYVYNWENLTNVNVDLSSVVASGTAIYIMNAQNYYATPVYSGTYSGGTVSLPMTGLTKAAGVAYTAQPWTGQAFNCFIVRAQSAEAWR